MTVVRLTAQFKRNEVIRYHSVLASFLNRPEGDQANHPGSGKATQRDYHQTRERKRRNNGETAGADEAIGETKDDVETNITFM
jgi:hypothetical protein